MRMESEGGTPLTGGKDRKMEERPLFFAWVSIDARNVTLIGMDELLNCLSSTLPAEGADLIDTDCAEDGGQVVWNLQGDIYIYDLRYGQLKALVRWAWENRGCAKISSIDVMYMEDGEGYIWGDDVDAPAFATWEDMWERVRLKAEKAMAQVEAEENGAPEA